MDFSGEPVPEADSTDGDLIHEFREDLTDDDSKDGLARDLFPLTTDEQKNYKFRLHRPGTLRRPRRPITRLHSERRR